MALTAQLDIETSTGDGDTSVAIDPAFWAANQATIQGYAKAVGVTLFFQDPKLSATSVSANVQTLADAKYQIDEAASASVVVGGGGGIKGAGPVASAGNGGLVVLAAGLSIVVVGSIAWLLSERRGRRA